MRYSLPTAALALALSGCQSGMPIPSDNQSDVSNAAVAQPLSPGARPVRVGENGANFAACGSLGIATLEQGKQIAVRAAPFVEGEKVGSLGAGRRMFICTRSIDQRWLGVVVPPASGQGKAMDDCGVTQRVDRPQPYDGPCLSGWVPNALVRLTAQ